MLLILLTMTLLVFATTIQVVPKVWRTKTILTPCLILPKGPITTQLLSSTESIGFVKVISMTPLPINKLVVIITKTLGRITRPARWARLTTIITAIRIEKRITTIAIVKVAYGPPKLATLIYGRRTPQRGPITTSPIF
jgi:hypothetical protein